MFGKLREKFKGWFKKEEKEKVDEIGKKSKKENVKDKKVNEKKQKSTKKIVNVKEKKKDISEKVVKERPKKIIKEAIKERPKEIVEKGSVESLPVGEPVFVNEKPLRKEVGREGDINKAIEEEIEDKQIGGDTPKEILEEELESEEPKGFFGKLKSKLLTSELKQEQFDEIFEELEMVLLENNVALGVVDKIHDSLSNDLVGISIKKSKIEETISNSLKNSILQVLIEPSDLIDEIEKSIGPYVILFFGINGSGKTTSVAKLAHKLKESGISCVLAAGDTFRAASIEQLETHANKIGVPIVKAKYNADPASVAFDAISYAKKHKLKAVLIDTAGRMYTRANLMKEMEKIVRVSKPNLKIFVGESITGNDATEQAKMFGETAGIDGIILTKADVDEKAGSILSVSYVTGKPIYFLGIGQEYGDLKDFKKADVLKNLGLD